MQSERRDLNQSHDLQTYLSEVIWSTIVENAWYIKSLRFCHYSFRNSEIVAKRH